MLLRFDIIEEEGKNYTCVLTQFVFQVFILLLITFNSSGKDRGINYNRNTTEQLKSNRVKEIRVFLGNKETKLTHIFLIDKHGVIISHLHYDGFSEASGPLTEEFNYTKNLHTYFRGRKAKDGIVQPYERITSTFSNDGIILRKVSEEYSDNLTITNESYNSEDAKEIDRKKYVIHRASGDTLRIIIHKKVKTLEEYTIYVKGSGQWIEEEKSITTYDSIGVYQTYSLYKNGVLNTRKINKQTEDVTDSIYRFDDENRNPLPVGIPSVDTLYSNTAEITWPLKSEKSGKFMIVVQNGFNHSPEQIFIYNSKGLMVKSIFVPNPEANERMEYSYW